MSLSAQEFGSNLINAPVEEKPIVEQKKGFNPDIDVSLTLGTSFSSFRPGMNMFGTYVMPEFRLPVSKKFAIQAGIGYSSMFYSSPGNEGTIFEQNNIHYGLIYVSGIYAVNPKLTIAGTAWKTFNLNQQPENSINPRALDFSSEGVAVNVDYKVTERFRVNVGFSYRKYNSYNYLGYPGMNGYPGGFGGIRPSPFGNSGFGGGFGPGF
jgi:hypothetical protein